MTTARRLFAERGYAGVSSTEIVAAAGLSRGALYHHYADKKDLLRAVFVEIESELSTEIQGSAAALGDQAELAMAITAGLDAYLSACERPEVVRIVLTDAPAVLGWQAWREIEAEHGLGLISTMLEEAMAAGLVARQPVRVLAQLLMSALIEAALLVAAAGEDRPAVRAEVRQALVTLFAGLLTPQSG